MATMIPQSGGSGGGYKIEEIKDLGTGFHFPSTWSKGVTPMFTCLYNSVFDLDRDETDQRISCDYNNTSTTGESRYFSVIDPLSETIIKEYTYPLTGSGYVIRNETSQGAGAIITNTKGELRTADWQIYKSNQMALFRFYVYPTRTTVHEFILPMPGITSLYQYDTSNYVTYYYDEDADALYLVYVGTGAQGPTKIFVTRVDNICRGETIGSRTATHLISYVVSSTTNNVSISGGLFLSTGVQALQNENYAFIQAQVTFNSQYYYYSIRINRKQKSATITPDSATQYGNNSTVVAKMWSNNIYEYAKDMSVYRPASSANEGFVGIGTPVTKCAIMGWNDGNDPNLSVQDKEYDISSFLFTTNGPELAKNKKLGMITNTKYYYIDKNNHLYLIKVKTQIGKIPPIKS